MKLLICDQSLGISFVLVRGPFLESPEKPFVKLRPAYSVKLIFSYVVKGIKIKITAKFCASRHLRLKIQRELWHPKYARKVSGLSRNRPLVLIILHYHTHIKLFYYSFNTTISGEKIQRINYHAPIYLHSRKNLNLMKENNKL